MHADPDVSIFADEGLAGMQAHPDTHRDAVGPGVVREGALGDNGRAERSVRAREGEEERVALRIDLPSAVLAARVANQPLMLGEDGGIRAAEPLEELCRPLDIREEEGDRARWQLGHSSSFRRVAWIVRSALRGVTRGRLLPYGRVRAGPVCAIGAFPTRS